MTAQTQRYGLYTYDVWGNSEDGYEVNNVFNSGEVEMEVEPVVYNAGTPQEFTLYDPTDLQIAEAIGADGPIEVDGEPDYSLYVESAEDGYPLCELRRIKEGAA